MVNFHDILGRIGPFAVIDVVLTFVGGYALAFYMSWRILPTIIAAFVVGELVHLFFNIDTPFTRLLPD